MIDNPVNPIPDGDFNPLEADVSVEAIKDNQLPQPRPENDDFSRGNVFSKSYNQTQTNSQELSESSNQANKLLDLLKSKQDEVIEKQAEIIEQVNTNIEDIEANRQAIEKNAQDIEANRQAIEKNAQDIELILKPPVTQLSVNSTFTAPANGEVLVLEFLNDADSRFNLTISSSIQVDQSNSNLSVSLRVGGVEKYTSFSTFTFPNFDIEANNGKVELYLVNSGASAINNIATIANINIRGI